MKSAVGFYICFWLGWEFSSISSLMIVSLPFNYEKVWVLPNLFLCLLGWSHICMWLHLVRSLFFVCIAGFYFQKFVKDIASKLMRNFDLLIFFFPCKAWISYQSMSDLITIRLEDHLLKNLCESTVIYSTRVWLHSSQSRIFTGGEILNT